MGRGKLGREKSMYEIDGCLDDVHDMSSFCYIQ